MSRRVAVALAVAGTVLVLGIVALVAVVATLSERPTVETQRGVVVNISTSSQAIAIRTDEGRNLSGPLATTERVRVGDRVVVQVIDDPNVVVVVRVRHTRN